MAPKHPKVAGYRLVEEIGGGGFGTVYRAFNPTTAHTLACKVILFTPQTTSAHRRMIDREIKLHRPLRHPHVLEFVEAVIVGPEYKERYVPGVYILLEMAAGGDLFDKIAPGVGISEEVGQHYFKQLVAGIEYIHKVGVAHRDLKPENVLLDAAGTLKISDFGLSATFIERKVSSSSRGEKNPGIVVQMKGMCGSRPYVAPEVRDGNTYDATPVDIWGIGVILFTMLAGNTPWDEATIQSPEFVRYVQEAIFVEHPWSRFSASVLALIRGLLTVDPDRRLTIAEISAHEWCASPSQLARMSAADIAHKLTESIRNAGDLAIAAPDMANGDEYEKDADGDSIMSTATQFTQSLMLFSQTQSGARYTPHLTRFYAARDPPAFIDVVQHALECMGVSCRRPPAPPASSTKTEANYRGPLRLRIKGRDRRLVEFKGWVNVEKFSKRGCEGSFCVMMRDQGSPISWRQLWKALILSKDVSPHVYRR